MDLNAFAQQKLVWYQYGSRSGQVLNEGDIDSLVVRNDSKVYIVNITDSGTDTKVRELEPTSQSGSHIYVIRTGYISLSSMTDNEDMFIRRINLNLQQSTHGDCTITVYLNHRYGSEAVPVPDVDGGQTVVKTFTPSVTGKDNIYSIRIGRRAKGFQLDIKLKTRVTALGG